MLTTEQLTTLKAAILADPALAPKTGGPGTDFIGLRDDCNAATSFIVWKSSVSSVDVGKAFDAAALDAMTSGNAEKLSNFRAWNETVYPVRADHRAFFDGVFSVASGATTRASLAALWRRPAKYAEKVLATGTGSDQTPGTLTFEGDVTLDEIRAMFA